jgi:hypothetical protein
MSALRWAAVPLAVGALGTNVAIAAADEPPQAPAAAPTPARPPQLTPAPVPTPIQPVTGTVVYITTVTTTTTIVNAPITVVAAPITTTVNNSTNSNTHGPARGAGARERFVIDLSGCGAARGQSGIALHDPVRRAKLRLAPTAVLVVRVNGSRVTTLRLPDSSRGVALQLRLSRGGMLTIRRPSGRVLSVQGCTPA